MWNFVKNFPLPLPFPIITGHGTEKVLLMKFEILGLEMGIMTFWADFHFL